MGLGQVLDIRLFTARVWAGSDYARPWITATRMMGPAQLEIWETRRLEDEASLAGRGHV